MGWSSKYPPHPPGKTKERHYLHVLLEVRIKGWDQWFVAQKYTHENK